MIHDDVDGRKVLQRRTNKSNIDGKSTKPQNVANCKLITQKALNFRHNVTRITQHDILMVEIGGGVEMLEN